MAQTTLFHIEGRDEIYTHTEYGAVARLFEYSVVAEPHKDLIMVTIVPRISLVSDVPTRDGRELMQGDDWGARNDMVNRLKRPIDPRDFNEYREDAVFPALDPKNIINYNGSLAGRYYISRVYVTASELTEAVSTAIAAIHEAITRMGNYCREVGKLLNDAQNRAINAENEYRSRVSANLDAIANLKDLIENLQKASR